MSHRTKAEFYKQGITRGFVDAAEVIVAAPTTEDWMIEIFPCAPDERMKVLSQLNTIKGEVDESELQALLQARSVS